MEDQREVVEPIRFDQEALFDRLAARGRLDLGLMRPLGAEVAGVHAGAQRRRDHGGGAAMRGVINDNAAVLCPSTGGTLDEPLCAALLSGSRAALEQVRPLLERRRADGYVRECHGDLHLSRIVLWQGRPTLLDAIEFDDERSCIDVHYDLAFLLMDLWRRRLPRHANAVFNGYLSATADFDGLAALPLFLSCRAAIRARTMVTASGLASDPAVRVRLRDTAREYLQAAVQLLRARRPTLVAIGGVSGAGKSTLAASLAPAVGPVPGAVVLCSDDIRKRLCGVPAPARLGANGYTEEVSRRVYDTLIAHAGDVVRAGHSAVVDAVFMSPADRAALESSARAAGVPFVGLWLEAPEGVLLDRVAHRSADASDADAAVVRMQVARDAGAVGWTRVDASGEPAAVHAQVHHCLESLVGGGITSELSYSPTRAA